MLYATIARCSTGLIRRRWRSGKRKRRYSWKGNMDTIMAHQDGVKNIVAVSGTAFTPYQLATLKRHAAKLCIFFDADPAGDMATRKSICARMGPGVGRASHTPG